MSKVLLSNVTVDGPGTGVQHFDNCLVVGRGVFDSARVEIEIAINDVPAEYVYIGDDDAEQHPGIAVFRRPSSATITVANGYWLRAHVYDAGPNTNITVETNGG